MPTAPAGTFRLARLGLAGDPPWLKVGRVGARMSAVDDGKPGPP